MHIHECSLPRVVSAHGMQKHVRKSKPQGSDISVYVLSEAPLPWVPNKVPLKEELPPPGLGVESLGTSLLIQDDQELGGDLPKRIPWPPGSL